jgi:hypothetical protein
MLPPPPSGPAARGGPGVPWSIAPPEDDRDVVTDPQALDADPDPANDAVVPASGTSPTVNGSLYQALIQERAESPGWRQALRQYAQGGGPLTPSEDDDPAVWQWRLSRGEAGEFEFGVRPGCVPIPLPQTPPLPATRCRSTSASSRASTARGRTPTSRSPRTPRRRLTQTASAQGRIVDASPPAIGPPPATTPDHTDGPIDNGVRDKAIPHTHPHDARVATGSVATLTAPSRGNHPAVPVKGVHRLEAPPDPSRPMTDAVEGFRRLLTHATRLLDSVPIDSAMTHFEAGLDDLVRRL